MTVATALEWLGSCSGCEIAFLNIGEELIEIVTELIDIVHAPILMDHKYFGPTGQGTVLEIPKATLGFVSGGVGNEEHLEVLQAMRKQCDILVALGTCATHGGIPALMNGQDLKQSWADIFATVSTDPDAAIPDIEVPPPLDRVYGCDEKVAIDIFLPGCPPHPSQIAALIRTVVAGGKPVLQGKSVCDTCPTRREGKGKVNRIKRCLTNARYESDRPLNEMQCLLEQGFLCMGPVTAAGCAHDEGPSCIIARVPCRGCYGPVRHDGNQLLDMMNALASNGIDYKSVVDRRSLLRFSGAHGLLRPKRQPRKKKRG